MIGTRFIKDASGALNEEALKLYSEAARWCNESQQGRIEDKGSFYEVVAIQEPTLPEAKAAKLAEINAQCDVILDTAVSSYPQSEVLTFDQQIGEVEKYLASRNPSDAPLLSALAQARGIELVDLCDRVIVKRRAFSALSGYVIGCRQRLEDVLDTLKTVEEVQALEIEIKLPKAAEQSGFFDGEAD